MELKKFKKTFKELMSDIENTNYGSLLTEFKLVLLLQEIALTNKITKSDVMKILDSEMDSDENSEAKTQALGEIYMNLQDAHKCVNIFDDYGKDYSGQLYVVLHHFISNGKLFDECNM